jgi:hypothetical protein
LPFLQPNFLRSGQPDGRTLYVVKGSEPHIFVLLADLKASVVIVSPGPKKSVVFRVLFFNIITDFARDFFNFMSENVFFFWFFNRGFCGVTGALVCSFLTCVLLYVVIVVLLQYPLQQ